MTFIWKFETFFRGHSQVEFSYFDRILLDQKFYLFSLVLGNFCKLYAYFGLKRQMTFIWKFETFFRGYSQVEFSYFDRILLDQKFYFFSLVLVNFCKLYAYFGLKQQMVFIWKISNFFQRTLSG